MKLIIKKAGEVIEQDDDCTQDKMGTALDKYDEEILKSITMVSEENLKVKDFDGSMENASECVVEFN